MICPLRLINIADQPDYSCVPACAMLRVIDNENEYNFICGLGDVPLAKGLVNIVNFDRQPKQSMPDSNEPVSFDNESVEAEEPDQLEE